MYSRCCIFLWHCSALVVVLVVIVPVERGWLLLLNWMRTLILAAVECKSLLLREGHERAVADICSDNDFTTHSFKTVYVGRHMRRCSAYPPTQTHTHV